MATVMDVKGDNTFWSDFLVKRFSITLVIIIIISSSSGATGCIVKAALAPSSCSCTAAIFKYDISPPACYCCHLLSFRFDIFTPEGGNPLDSVKLEKKQLGI